MASRGRGSKKKGADFERRLAKILSNKFGVEVKRTPAQESAKIHGGDVNAHKGSGSIITDFFWEAKNRESLPKTILDWYKKAEDDCGVTSQIPLVVATKNHEDNYVFLKLDDFLRILYELEGFRQEE